MGDIARIEFDAVVATTPKAVLLEVQGEDVWVPRSVIVDPKEGEGMDRGDPAGEVEILSWFARKEGLDHG